MSRAQRVGRLLPAARFSLVMVPLLWVGVACSGSISDPSLPDAPAPPYNPVAPGELVAGARAPTPFRGQMMGRHYIRQVFEDVFYPSAPTEKQEKAFARAVRSIMETPSSFGRACDPYSTRSARDCEGEVLTVSSAQMTPSSTVVRQVEKLAVCEQILHDTSLLRVAAERAGGGSEDGLLAPRKEHVEAAWRLFFRADDPGPEQLSPLEKLVEGLQRAGVSVDDQWRGLLQLVCEQPGWEVV